MLKCSASVQSLSYRDLLVRRRHRTALFLQSFQAFVEPFDADRHIFSSDTHSGGSVEVRTGVRLRVGHKPAKRVSAYGLLLAQWYHPGNTSEHSNTEQRDFNNNVKNNKNNLFILCNIYRRSTCLTNKTNTAMYTHGPLN